jgi:hypothetical protein
LNPQRDEAIAAALTGVRARIATACARAGRSPVDVCLLAVAKGHGPDAIEAAYAAGQRDFGENYVQELTAKAEALRSLVDLRLHFIGRLQRNKAKQVVAVAHAVQSVDSLPLAEALSQRAAALGRSVRVLLQVNGDREAQKAGALPETLPALVDAVRLLPGLVLEGLMTIPRAEDDPERSRAAFRALRELGMRFDLRELSMGMSHDFEVAIEEGATIVRVGTAIFGQRPG